MAHCYRCGKPLDKSERHLRRRVKTGEHERRTYRQRRVDAIQSSYGMRIVCGRCAIVLDGEAFRLSILSDLRVVAAMILLAVAVAMRAWLS